MRIVMVWDGDYPWDVRVEKICRTLLGHGHEVHLVCRNGKALPRRETLDGLQIRRTVSLRSKGVLNSLLTFPAFFSPVWRHEVRKALDEIQPDVVVIRDLPIALAVTPFTRRKRIPVVLDMAECYPEMIRCAWKFEPFRPANLLVRNPYLADRVEKRVLENLDMAWVMVEESGARLVKKGFAAEKIRIVSNTPPHAVGPPVPGPSAPAAGMRKTGSPLRLFYVGLVNPSRGLATVVEAAQRLKANGTAFELKIVGSGKDFARIKRMVEEKGLQAEVTLAGWIDHKQVGKLLEDTDVGLVPHYRCSHWDNTIPNKVFDYMKAGIPVVVSDAIPAKRIVEETGAGLSYDSFDAADLARQLETLVDPARRAELGANGVKAIQARYNWETDSRTLLNSLEDLLRSRVPASQKIA